MNVSTKCSLIDFFPNNQSQSFTSKAALHGHTRIHCIGRNSNAFSSNASNGQILSGTSIAINTQEDFPSKTYPCKICAKWVMLNISSFIFQYRFHSSFNIVPSLSVSLSKTHTHTLFTFRHLCPSWIFFTSFILLFTFSILNIRR